MPGAAIDAVFERIDEKRSAGSTYAELQLAHKRAVFLACVRAGLVCRPCKRVFATKYEADVHHTVFHANQTGRQGRYHMRTVTQPCPKCGKQVRYVKKHARHCKAA
jgi:hypothetical protein